MGIRNPLIFLAGVLMAGAMGHALWLGDIRLALVYGAYAMANFVLSTLSG